MSPGGKKVNGFYSMSKNQAVVKFDPARPAQTIGTTFHEISHLITAAHLGPTPPWLTEGLSEYFETMQVQGQGGVVYPSGSHINLLQSSALPSLQEYLAFDRPEWHTTRQKLCHCLVADPLPDAGLAWHVRAAGNRKGRPGEFL